MTHPIVKRRRKVGFLLVLLTLWGFFCIACFVAGIQEIITSPATPLAVITLSSLAGFFVLRYFKIMHGMVARTKFAGSQFGRQLGIALYAVIIFGFTSGFLFVMANNVLARNDLYQYGCPITDKQMYTPKNSTENKYAVSFTIMKHNKVKDFDEPFSKSVNASDSILIHYKKGILGCFIITSYTLNK